MIRERIRRRLTIRIRLAIAFAAALIVVLSILAVFVYARVSSELTTQLDNSLRSRADDLASLVTAAGGTGLGEGSKLLDTAEGFSQVLDSNGVVAGSSLSARAVAALSPAEVRRASGEPLLIAERELTGVEGPARVLARPAGDTGLVVVAAASTDDRDEAVAGLIRGFVIAAPMALALALGLGYLLAGRSLMPVESMRRKAAQITLERSGERLPLPEAEDEIRRLGATLNVMLDRIEAALERERVFVADASHELRTPLAILRTELELADQPGRSPQELRMALSSASEEVERLSRLAEDLLVIARSDRGALPIKREQVALRDLLERVRDRFAGRAADLDRELVIEAPAGAQASIDPIRIEQALGNLIDNALRHGRGAVTVVGSRHPDSTVFEVLDQGPGFPEGFSSQAFERFTRPDGGRASPGAGLGLAIVRAIARAHGGEAEIITAEAGSGGVRIVIPSEPA